MNSKKVFFLLVAVCVLLIGAAGFATYTGAAFLKSKGTTILEYKLQNAVLEDKELAIIQAKKDIETYAELEKVAKSIVPQEKDQARTVREIDAIATDAGVPLTSIEFPESALGTVKNTSKKAIIPNTSQLTEVPGMKGLYAMDITVAANEITMPVEYSKVLNMLGGLERNRRTAYITALTITPNKDNRNLVNFTLTIKVYIKP